MPAGTGVCVVKMQPGSNRFDRFAEREVSSTIARRMRSRPRKPAWPSLVWNTSASMPSASSARTPPMPEEELLLQAVLDIAAVESIGDRPQLRRVLVDVGVEQVERHTADIGAPHLRNERLAGEVDRDPNAVAGVSAMPNGSRSG